MSTSTSSILQTPPSIRNATKNSSLALNFAIKDTAKQVLKAGDTKDGSGEVGKEIARSVLANETPATPLGQAISLGGKAVSLGEEIALKAAQRVPGFVGEIAEGRQDAINAVKTLDKIDETIRSLPSIIGRSPRDMAKDLSAPPAPTIGEDIPEIAFNNTKL